MAQYFRSGDSKYATCHLPIVPLEVIRENIPRFAEIPELVLLLALAARHAPDPEDIEAVRSALESPVPDLRALAATAASILGGEVLEAALQEAAGREKDEAVRRVMTATLHQFSEKAHLDLTGGVSVEVVTEGITRSGQKFSDIAIEVIWTSGGIDKLEIYRKLGVPEVWFWKDGRIEVHCLRGEQYVRNSRSEFLPALDLAVLASVQASWWR